MKKKKPGRPVTRVSEPIPATPEDVVRAIYAARVRRPSSQTRPSGSSKDKS